MLSYTVAELLLWGVPMITKIDETDQGRIAREQFDTFERQERLIRTEERAERAARLNLPVNLSNKLRQRKENLRLKGRRRVSAGRGFALTA
jgi:hypothetical protein